MKILILGAGRVGSSVAENLVSEQNDITIVDLDATLLAALQERLDLRVVAGNCTHISVLEAAGAHDADMLIACTASDEANLVACRVARLIFNVPQRIARIRSQEFYERPELIGSDGFCIDHLISPERSVTTYLHRLIAFPQALQVVDFANGQVTLALVHVEKSSAMAHQLAGDVAQLLPGVPAHILLLFRQGKPIEVAPQTMVEANDELLVLVDARHARRALQELRAGARSARRVMIAGGGNIGSRLAHELAAEGYAVKVIENNLRRCEHLSTMLPAKVLVLHGDATDEVLLEDENIEGTDVFLALTNDDENNIMSALLAKRMGARRVMSLIGRRSYGELMEGSRIDVALAPDQATIGELLRHVRRGDVVAVHKLRRGATEALEAIAHGDAASSKVVGRRVRQIKMPHGASIGALVRGERILTPDQDPVIESDDHVIILVTRRRVIPAVEALFQVSASFF